MADGLEHVITCPLCNESLTMKRSDADGDRARQRFLSKHLDGCRG